jgi:hypothetical protein
VSERITLMALSEKSRTRIYLGLEPMLGEEATAEMLAYFPARDGDEPATEEFVRAEIAALRGSMETLEANTEARFADLRGSTEAGFAELRGSTEARIETLRADMHAALHRMVFALVAVIAAATGIILSAMVTLAD